MKLKWADIVGGAKSPEPGAGIAGAPEPEVVAEGPGTMIEKANTWLDQALDMIRKIDEFAGIYLQLKELNKQSEGTGQMTSDPSEGNPTANSSPGANPAPPAPDINQIIALLEIIIKGEGDIPLSKFVQGLRNQEPWLIQYVIKAAQGDT